MKYHVLLEINNSSLSPEGYRGDTKFTDLVILNLSVHFNYPVLFSSDSHGKSHVGDFTYACRSSKACQSSAESDPQPLGKITVELPGGEIISGRTSTSSSLIK